MTLNGVLQITVYLVVLILLAKPLGSYMARVYQGEHTFLDRILQPIERLIYRLAGVDPAQEMNWKVYAVAMLVFNLVGLLAVYAPAAAAARPAAKSARDGGGNPGFILQYRGQLCHQHQLAGLRRRDHHELPDPDAGADGAELRLGCHRHGDPGRFHPRPGAPFGARRWAISGWT